MTKKELWTEIFGWCRNRHKTLINSNTFKEGNIAIEGRLFANALFSDAWVKLTAISDSGASFEDDIIFLRKLIGKVIVIESKESPYLIEKKLAVMELIRENGKVYEHQVAKIIGTDGRELWLNSAMALTILGMLEKEGSIRKDGNSWEIIS